MTEATNCLAIYDGSESDMPKRPEKYVKRERKESAEVDVDGVPKIHVFPHFINNYLGRRLWFRWQCCACAEVLHVLWIGQQARVSSLALIGTTRSFSTEGKNVQVKSLTDDTMSLSRTVCNCHMSVNIFSRLISSQFCCIAQLKVCAWHSSMCWIWWLHTPNILHNAYWIMVTAHSKHSVMYWI